VSTIPIRVAAKAVIVQDGEVLLTCNLHPDDPDGEFFLLPGGGQQYGEPLADCLLREVLEETGYSVEVGDVLWVRDYVGASHEFAAYEPDVHQVEVMFSCTIDRDRAPLPPTEEDPWQLSVEWVSASDLAGIRFFPAAMLGQLVDFVRDGTRTGRAYLGDVN
jgi:8-oxo-dGTP pyrophosphatase MutT (NUDIX family)